MHSHLLPARFPPACSVRCDFHFGGIVNQSLERCDANVLEMYLIQSISTNWRMIIFRYFHLDDDEDDGDYDDDKVNIFSILLRRV